uniref:Uncharacterized protein n=1 Tax=Anopheles albimanus TaxID=7167 RepID=A0A182FXV6_ANOAL
RNNEAPKLLPGWVNFLSPFCCRSATAATTTNLQQQKLATKKNSTGKYFGSNKSHNTHHQRCAETIEGTRLARS